MQSTSPAERQIARQRHCFEGLALSLNFTSRPGPSMACCIPRTARSNPLLKSRLPSMCGHPNQHVTLRFSCRQANFTYDFVRASHAILALSDRCTVSPCPIWYPASPCDTKRRSDSGFSPESPGCFRCARAVKIESQPSPALPV